MKKRTVLWAFLILAGLLMRSVGAFAQPEPGEDKTLSPYFFVKSDDPDLDQLPLKSTSAHVRISGVSADVAVTQVYKNEGKRPTEAIYIFPASTRAAVYSMKMTIGGELSLPRSQSGKRRAASMRKPNSPARVRRSLSSKGPMCFR